MSLLSRLTNKENRKSQVVFVSNRTEYDTRVKELLGHNKFYNGLLTKNSIYQGEQVPENRDLRILREESAKVSFNVMCKHTESELKIALDYPQLIEMFHKMPLPKYNTPINMILLYRLFGHCPKEHYDILKAREKGLDLTDLIETDANELIQKDLFNNMVYDPIAERESLQLPVIVVFYDTEKTALTHLYIKRNVIKPTEYAKLEQQIIKRVAKEKQVIESIKEANIPGVVFSPDKDLLRLPYIVGGILKSLDTQFEWLNSRGIELPRGRLNEDIRL